MRASLAPKCVLTTVGAMTVNRRYFACGSCGATQTPLDGWAGIGARMVSDHAAGISSTTVASNARHVCISMPNVSVRAGVVRSLPIDLGEREAVRCAARRPRCAA